MDSRTKKIRDLSNKLSSARNFIRSLAHAAADLKENEVLSKSYWIKSAIYKLEETKE